MRRRGGFLGPVPSFMALALLGLAVGGCAHRPETVVHLTASTGGPKGAWVVRDPTGGRLCALPCTVELDSNETVIVDRQGGPGTGTSFILHQESLGAGTWSGRIQTKKEQSSGASTLAALSSALVSTGTSMLQTRGTSREDRGEREDRTAAGIVLSGLGTVGLFASDAIPRRTREELWLDRMSASSARD